MSSNEKRSLLEQAPAQNHSYSAVSCANNTTISEPSSSQQAKDKPVVVVPSLPLALTAIYSGVFLAALDQTIVATIFPAIGNDFNALNKVSWIGTSYILTSTAFQPLFGRISDIFGRRFAFLIGQIIFLIGSIGCGLSTGSIWTLVAWRLIAGIGGAGIIISANILMNDLVSLRDRAVLQGIGNAVFATAALSGPPLGGFFADHMSWRWAFFINVPLGIPAIILTLKYLSDYNLKDQLDTKTTVEKLGRIDYAGIITLLLTVGFFVLGLSLVDEMERTDWRLILIFIAFVITLLLFIVSENYAKEPISPLRLLKPGTPSAVYYLVCCLYIAATGVIFLVPVFLVAARGQSASSAGLHLIPKIVAGCLTTLLIGLYVKQTGKYSTVTLIGLIIMVIADIAILLRWNDGTTELELYVSLVFDGMGFGVPLITSAIALLAALPVPDMAVGVAMSYMFRSVGQILGIALPQAAFQFALKSRLEETITGSKASEIIELVRKNTDSIANLPTHTKDLVVAAYTYAFKCGMVIVCIGGVLALFASRFVGVHDLGGKKKEEEVEVAE